MKFLSTVILFIATLLFVSCDKGDDTPDSPDLSEAGHPRILLLKGEEQQIRDLINSDETWKKMHLAIIEKSKLSIIPSSLDLANAELELVSIYGREFIILPENHEVLPHE